jgi:eukaryotic-like serine/threonine-protein kinase
VTNERWEKIQTIYHRAAQFSSAELERFLADACSGDFELRREVESLLASKGKSLAFVEKAVGEAAAEIEDSLRSTGTKGRRPPGWMYLLLASFAAMHVLILYESIWGTVDVRESHTAFEDGGMRLQMVEGGSDLALAGLAAGDRVIAIDGRPVRNPRDWNIAQANRDPSLPQHWEILRGAERLELNLNPARTPFLNQFRRGEIGYIGTGITCFLLGLLMAFQRPSDPVARMGAWFIMAASVAFGISGNWAFVWRQFPVPVQLLLWVPEISRFVIDGILLSLFVLFPRRLFHSRWLWALIWTPVLMTLPWRITGFNSIINPRAEDWVVPDWLNRAIFMRTMFYLLAAIVILIFSYRRLTSSNERRRVRVLAAGTAVGFASAVFLVWQLTFVGYGLRFENWTQSAFVLLLACPLSFYYAIIRHRAFDIQIIIRQGLQYALARGAVLGVIPILGAIFVLDLALNSEQRLNEIMRSRGWIYTVLAVIVALIYRQRKQWLDSLDRRFFRERYDAERVLREIVKHIGETRSFEEASLRVVAKVEAALHPEFVSVMAHEQGEPDFHSVASAPSGHAPQQIPANSKLAALVRLTAKPLEIRLSDSSSLERRLPDEELRFVRLGRFDLLIPIVIHEGPVEALLALGMKRSEEPYTRQDQELLEAIASGMALLLTQPTQSAPHPSVFAECPDCGSCYDTSLPARNICTHDGSILITVPLSRVLSGRYRLQRRLGRGGMGAVYEATDVALERNVAVKVIRDDLVSSPDMAQQFQREARAAAGFSHRNVVTVHDYGVDSGTRAFLVMELLKGTTLRGEIARCKRLTRDSTVEIFRDICAAVEAAHRKQLVHRDLKPENIFLADTAEEKMQTVKVLDFGIAKFVTAPTGDDPTQITKQTDVSALVGTPAYMSPEQLLGATANASWDLWALAVVAYECLAGVLPFPSSSRDWRHNILAGSFPPIRQHVAEAPLSWQKFFQDCFSPNSLTRPVSATDFLERFEAGCANR